MTITLTVDTNTFISLADAETYFSERLNSDVWDAEDDEDKKKALIMATKRINKLPFIGEQEVETQPLAFPRYVSRSTNPQISTYYLIRDLKEITTPDDVKEATCEEALALLTYSNSVHYANQQMGIQSMSMGNESVSYNGSGADNKLLSQDAQTLVEKWIKKGFDKR